MAEAQPKPLVHFDYSSSGGCASTTAGIPPEQTKLFGYALGLQQSPTRRRHGLNLDSDAGNKYNDLLPAHQSSKNFGETLQRESSYSTWPLTKDAILGNDTLPPVWDGQYENVLCPSYYARQLREQILQQNGIPPVQPEALTAQALFPGLNGFVEQPEIVAPRDMFSGIEGFNGMAKISTGMPIDIPSLPNQLQAELARMQSGMSFTENPYMASKFQAEQQALMADLLPLDFGSPPTPPLSRETSDKQRRTKSSLYKTELCHSWTSVSACRYGSDCQFAHGEIERRPIPRHPKYKTQLCRNYATSGVCAYGAKCRFIHDVPGSPSDSQLLESLLKLVNGSGDNRPASQNSPSTQTQLSKIALAKMVLEGFPHRNVSHNYNMHHDSRLSEPSMQNLYKNVHLPSTTTKLPFQVDYANPQAGLTECVSNGDQKA